MMPEDTLNNRWGIWICSSSSLFFITLHHMFSRALFLTPSIRSACCSFTPLVVLVWSQRQHSSLTSPVDHDWCLLATAFDTVSTASPFKKKNKRRISFETHTHTHTEIKLLLLEWLIYSFWGGTSSPSGEMGSSWSEAPKKEHTLCISEKKPLQLHKPNAL